jgi:hypothetical protein
MPTPRNAVLNQQNFVWERLSEDEVIVYVCFQRLSDGKFCVQNGELFRRGKGIDQWNRLMQNTGSFFLDDGLDTRGGWFDSLAKAIAAHKKAFF